MGQWRPLRVLIVCRQKKFGHVLAANVRCWGYEALVLPSLQTMQDDRIRHIEGDILLYDLDESWYPSSEGQEVPVSWEGGVADGRSGHPASPLPVARLTIVLSTYSVSRVMLEHIGAVAFLQKPIIMADVRRYLSVLQRVLCYEARSESHEERRVLVVDDNVDIAHTIQHYLVYEFGYEVAVAHDGLAALEQCLDWCPQCVVTDLLMPLMNGYQVMRSLSVGLLRATPAFVVMSALTRLELPVSRSYLEGRVVAYVDKPFSLEHLFMAIKQVCAG